MRLMELQEIIEIYNEVEPNKSRCIDYEEVKANIADPYNDEEIQFFIELVIDRIDGIGVEAQ